METLIATTKVSEDGKVTLPVPGVGCGDEVEVRYSVKAKRPAGPVDQNGWPLGFWETFATDPITDPAFKRYPQPPADPPPSFE